MPRRRGRSASSSPSRRGGSGPIASRLELLMRECQLGGPLRLVSDVEANELRPDSTQGGAPMNLTPLGDRVIVKAVEQEMVSPSGIVLPDTAKERPQRGTVLAVGLGRWGDDGERVPLGVAVGDEVIYAKYGG